MDSKLGIATVGLKKQWNRTGSGPRSEFFLIPRKFFGVLCFVMLSISRNIKKQENQNSCHMSTN